jgi:transcriptional regulator of acetoin/glycerol metabolism
VLLNFFGDPAFTHAASRTGLMQGAIWSEQAQGTNGMGTCLVERRPVTVHQGEHYLARNTGLSCAAAPLFNHLGELVAVLDASGESSRAQQHTLALVNASVQMIENRVFLQQFSDKVVLRFHNRAEFVGTLSEGAIALSACGTVLAATRRALLLLGAHSPADIVGREITELFKLSFAGLIDSCVKTAFHPVPIFEIRRGARFFAVAYGPAPTPARAISPRGQPKMSEAAASTPPPVSNALDELHGGDPAMARNIQVARRVMERNVAIVLLGETGTGKELFAQAIHRCGSRANQPFVAINCASIPEALIESELFGYVSGSFTGARKDGHAGKLLHANGGTLFLDEIGDMPVSLQARLLRVLEEREVLPLGGKVPIKLDIRLISATHCDLEAKIATGEFREDLYYRLHGVAISMPPLRERTDFRHLAARIVQDESVNDGAVSIGPSLMATLERQAWPGNIRQLRQLLRSMIALREGDVLTLADLPPQMQGGAAAADPADGGTADSGADQPSAPSGMNPLECAERDALVQELIRHDWNISTLARALHISRNTLYRKLQRLHISNPDKHALH